MLSADQLINKVRKAFEGSVLPSACRCDANLDFDTLEEEQVWEYFCDKAWGDITLDKLRKEYDGDIVACPSFMRTEILHYYLPAYLIISIVHYHDADLIADVLVGILLPRQGYKFGNSRITALLEMFNLEQYEVVKEYLLFMKDMHPEVGYISDDDFRAGLECYWKYELKGSE